jgi:predicted aspartyl protease
MRVTLTNARERVMARLGHLAPEAVHTTEVEAVIDTGTMRSVVPPTIADALGLVRMGRTEAQMADGRWGETVLLGATVLEGMDLVVDCACGRLVPHVGTWAQPVFRV